ncbi:MAG: serine/threonine-protein kinase, partial [Gemmataceae bacterium]
MPETPAARSAQSSTGNTAATEATLQQGGTSGIDLRFLAPAEAPDELGRLGHYRILKQLGAGGMGVVFLAEDTLLARPVALKIMQPTLAGAGDGRERFLREARAAAALTHDHVVTIHQVGEHNGAPFLAMQLLQGESLDDYLKRGNRLTPGQICRVGREVATGLAAAHARGLIHRDIKPANLWLEAPKGRVKILDFGLARSMTDGQLTGSGTVLGTPAYMAPEQARAVPDLDGRCDLWSLGVLLYRLATGRLPFAGDDTFSLLTAIAVDEPTPPEILNPDLPTDLASLIRQLLAKKREARPASAADIAQRLQVIERSLSKPAAALATEATESVWTQLFDATESVAEPAPTTTAYVPPRKPRSRIALALGGLAAFLALGQIVIWITDKNGNKTKIEPAPGAFVEVKVGDKTVAKIEPKADAPKSPFPPLDPAWIEKVANLPPDRQVNAVADELKRRNPGFDGQATPEFRGDGAVAALTFSTDAVRDLTPVRALPKL